MGIVLDGTSGLTSPAAVLTTTPLAVTSGGTGVTTSTGTGAVVLGTAPTITGATITVAATAAPAFSAYQSSGQTLSAATFTKIQFQTEEFDTANAFDSTTNYRFTPQVAGYYQVSGAISNNTGTQTVITIYKNGADFKRGNNGSLFGDSVSALVYLNGSTDYVELYGYLVAGGALNTGGNLTYFQAAMVRSA